MLNEQTPAGKAVRRYGARLAKNRRWDDKTANVIARAYGDNLSKHFERKAPYFQHQPTGLYVQHKASVINTATQLTGEHEYSIPGIGHAAIIAADELRPAHPEVDVLAAARHNRTLLRRSPWSETIGRFDPNRRRRPPSDAGPTHTVGESWEDPIYLSGRGNAGAWISPRGNYHPLARGQNHYDWVHANAEKLGVTMPKKVTRSLMGDTTEPEHELLKAGWIKKSDATVYEAHKLDDGLVRRIRRHMREYHPDESHFALQVGRGRGVQGHSLPVWEQLELVQRLVLEVCAGVPVANLVSLLLHEATPRPKRPRGSAGPTPPRASDPNTARAVRQLVRGNDEDPAILGALLDKSKASK